MKKQISKTCPKCGKLNSIHEGYCTNCGAKLPAIGDKTVGYTQRKSRKQPMIVFSLLALFLVAGIVLFSIQQNQKVLRTSSVNVIPIKIEFFNQHNRQVMVRYIKGKTRKSRNGYASGTLVVSKKLKHDHGQEASFFDSRARKSLVINSQPKMTFYYKNRYGKFNDYGNCKVAGMPEIRQFRMIKMDSGAN
ncbi:zinc ribbon domain-containing protein [Limosilactobacillus viscerum]|uniref:zinc ribbon domain-containing protein n=1 Tax=Limosilactobacillus viscerum TaxID=2993450 RepID=UPI0024B94EF1|nr:zinc ribbon domain-containing protein [Limosilactobacillus viscerum]